MKVYVAKIYYVVFNTKGLHIYILLNLILSYDFFLAKLIKLEME